jgi:polysaccharide export outer membrane protein
MAKKYSALAFITLLTAAAPRLEAQTTLPPAQATEQAQAAQRVERAQAVAAAQPVERAQPVALASTAPQALPSAPNPAAVPLRNGDTVDIRISNVPPEDEGQWDAPYTVDETGGLNLPFIGMIKAGGLPPSQVQITIQNKLISEGIYTNPTITVNPPAGMRFVSVGGGVRQPGRVPYTSDLTLMSTINAAGGTSDFAGDKIRLVRAGKILFFSKKKLYKDPSADPHIEPGDQIEVVESMW